MTDATTLDIRRAEDRLTFDLQPEIGRRMGRTEGAIKALHHRTLGQLQEALGEP